MKSWFIFYKFYIDIMYIEKNEYNIFRQVLFVGIGFNVQV